MNLLLHDSFHPAALQADALALPVAGDATGYPGRDQARLVDRYEAAIGLIDHQQAAGFEVDRLRLGDGEQIQRYQPLGGQTRNSVWLVMPILPGLPV